MEVKQTFNAEKCSWINIDTTKAHEVENLKKDLSISNEMLNYSLDKNERARVEYDAEDEALLVVFNVPHLTKTDNHYETSPMSFIMKDSYFITFVNERTDYVEKIIEDLLKKDSQQTTASLLFHSLFMISDNYFPLIDEVNNQRVALNKKLRQKTTNKNLLEMSDLEIGLVYLVTATRQNTVLLEQVKAQTIYQAFNAQEKEELDDVLIEARQAVEMTRLASDILDQLSGTYNNLLNNNLNDTMKILTIWSLLLTIPTIVSGFFGMNMPLPFENSEAGWIISLVISLALSAWLIILLWRRIK
ncbi:magnesium transporter CorA family protein [Enterococcus alishanensis]|uniref:Magnesium transporter CorA family protein n=1 Tax=Enterococcus alishanensis TaxID=1303817 RepID=A0ABS6TEA5_9ENTE|nr:magnesium transporter CorA family protein [Enterococcus alishanensis]MBV7391261.1 magnesium transporter CorA family protein [Enterococcus alishanensis]